jgi:hypothetical protein
MPLAVNPLQVNGAMAFSFVGFVGFVGFAFPLESLNSRTRQSFAFHCSNIARCQSGKSVHTPCKPPPYGIESACLHDRTVWVLRSPFCILGSTFKTSEP